jgi:hypothetical protein
MDRAATVALEKDCEESSPRVEARIFVGRGFVRRPGAVGWRARKTVRAEPMQRQDDRH